MTKLYLSNILDTTTSNLPTTEQSTLTSALDLNAQSQNRKMYTGKGAVAENIAPVSTAFTVANKNMYVGKWVYILDNTVTSISANTWTYYVAAGTNNSTAKFAMNAAKQAYVNLYVWRPGTGKVGTVFDGLTSASTTTHGNSYQINQHTFSGSAVNSLQTGDALVLEVWSQTTATTASNYITYYFLGGDTDNYAEGTNNPASPATYLETPQTLPTNGSIPFTKLYFHDALSGLSSLPTTEQSTLTINYNTDAQTVNRTMNETIGTSQVSKVMTIEDTGTERNYYVTRFVSQQLTAQTIPAVTWSYSFAAAESDTSVNYPDNPQHICFYLWRPGTGKITDILIGNSGIGVVETSTANSERSMFCTFSGATFTSQAGDVLCFEVINIINPSTGTGRTATYYYDGTTETSGTNVVVSNHATHIVTSSDIEFSSGAVPVDCTVTGKLVELVKTRVKVS